MPASRLPFEPSQPISHPLHSARALAFSALLLSSLFLLFLLPGCVNPNSNLSYSTCCLARPAFYTCQVEHTDPATGEQKLKDCGPCFKRNATGTIFNSNNVAIDAGQCTDNCNFVSANCTGLDNKSTCYLVDNTGTTNTSVAPICANATPNSCIQNQCSARMCGEPVPNPKGRMDGDSTNQVVDKKNTQLQNSYLQLAMSDQAVGLVGKVCAYFKMDQRANRLLNAKDWFVDSLRLGVGGTFSDYDRSRYYLPPSDFYCSRTTPGAVVDRFTQYLDGTKPLAVFGTGLVKNQCTPKTCTYCTSNQIECTSDADCPGGLPGACGTQNCMHCSCPGNTCGVDGKDYISPTDCDNGCRTLRLANDFKTPLSYCKAELDNSNAITSYYCADKPNLKYDVSTLGQNGALLACNNACNFNRFRSCSDNTELLLASQSVSPPIPNTKTEYWPFVDIYNYSKVLAAAYPTPAPNSGTGTNLDPRNYYKPLLQPTLNGKPNPDFFSNQSLPGPAGAKVFECSSNGDCLSGACDQSSYLRGSCFLGDGTPVDCGCHYVSDCKREYNCAGLPDQSGPRRICDSNLARCEASFGGQDKSEGRVVTVCDYQPTSFAVFSSAVGIAGGTDSGDYPLCHGNSGLTGWEYRVSALDRFTCKPYSNSNVPPIEFANRQVFNANAPVCDMGGGVYSETVCKAGSGMAFNWSTRCTDYNHKAESTWIGSDCEGNDCGWEDKNFYTLKGDYGANTGCPADGTRVMTKSWRDNQIWDADHIRWGSTWTYDIFAVPDRPAVAGPYNYSVNVGGQKKLVKGLLFTSQSVHFCGQDGNTSLSGLACTCDDHYPEKCDPVGGNSNLAILGLKWSDVKFKLIQACNMKYGTDIVLYRPDMNDPNSPVPPDFYGGFAEKTWLILSFGSCQTDATGAPVVQSYGICRPCSTSLTLASQNVSKTPSTYCPSSCNIFSSFDGQKLCKCGDAKNLPAANFPAFAGPDTYPDYGFIAGKVNEYQQAGIMPLLDMRTYTTATPAPSSFLLWNEKCESYGAIMDRTDTVQYNGGYIDVNVCKSSGYPNFLLSYLANNHSAAIIDVADLPASGNPDAADLARAKVALMKTSCSDCMAALEYPTPISLNSLAATPYNYPQALNDSIFQYSGGVKFDPDRMDPPAWPDKPGPSVMSSVSMLILNIDLSTADSDPAILHGQITQLINLSRHTLQQVGWPTILRLTYTRGHADAMTNEAVYKALYSRQAELTLAGVGGILLPPLDNANHTPLGQTYSDASAPADPGRLLDSGGNRAEVNTANTAFCAAQNGSTMYLHPKIAVGLQKLFTRPTCGCVPCSAIDIASGKCGPTTNLCYDNSQGLSNAIDPNSFCKPNIQKCEPYCISNARFQAVNSTAVGSMKTTCTAMRSTNEPPVECCDATRQTNCHDWPDCDIQRNIPLSDLANDLAHPDASYLIAGLPHTGGVVYGLQSGTSNYTYSAVTSVDMSPEPVLFPKYGSNTSDCGRTNMPGIDTTQVACGTPLPPVLDTFWTCTTPVV